MRANSKSLTRALAAGWLMPIVALAQPVVNPLSACILDDQDRNRRPYFAGTILDFHPDYLTRSIGQSEVLHPVRVYLKETANGWLVGEETCIVGHEGDINKRHDIPLIAKRESDSSQLPVATFRLQPKRRC